jgi:hypothetical protein
MENDKNNFKIGQILSVFSTFLKYLVLMLQVTSFYCFNCINLNYKITSHLQF